MSFSLATLVPNEHQILEDEIAKTETELEAHSLPPEVANKVQQARSHSFFIKDGDNAIVLVSPNDRRVADVIR